MPESSDFSAAMLRLNDLADDLSAAGLRFDLQLEDHDAGQTVRIASAVKPRRA